MNTSRKKSANIDFIIAREKKKQAMKNIMTGILVVFGITLVITALATITTITREYISGPTLQPAPARFPDQPDDLTDVHPFPQETLLEEIVVPDGNMPGPADDPASLDPIARILAQGQGIEHDTPSPGNNAEKEKTPAIPEPVPVREIVSTKQINKDGAPQAAGQRPEQSAPPPAETPPAEPSGKSTDLPGKYPLASTRILTAADLAGIPASELKIMRNEIFARHGYIFTTSSMKDYFTGQRWYQPKHASVTGLLSPVEVANVEFLQRTAQKKTK